MTAFNWPPIEDLDVEDLLTLPEGYRYELHGGNLVIRTPSNFWHKAMAGRIYVFLLAAGLNAFQDPGVLGDRRRDNRLPDVGVIDVLPPGLRSYSNLPGSAYLLVVEVISENSPNGEYTDKMAWYAQRGIPEYWIVEETSEHADDEAVVQIYRLTVSNGKAAYGFERTLLLSELEAEYRAR
jgi:Uma2 family endonuclease